MKLLVKILFFVFAIFQANISVAKIIDYKDDGDDNIYLNKRKAENIIGTEQVGKTYKVGEYLEMDDIFSSSFETLPKGFILQYKTKIQEFEVSPLLGGIKGGIKYVLYWARGSKAAKGVLPTLDATGKVHGSLPKVADFGKYSKDELRILLKELKQSVQKRIEVTSKMGKDRAHGQRQGAEQDLVKSLEKYLGQ